MNLPILISNVRQICTDSDGQPNLRRRRDKAMITSLCFAGVVAGQSGATQPAVIEKLKFEVPGLKASYVFLAGFSTGENSSFHTGVPLFLNSKEGYRPIRSMADFQGHFTIHSSQSALEFARIRTARVTSAAFARYGEAWLELFPADQPPPHLGLGAIKEIRYGPEREGWDGCVSPTTFTRAGLRKAACRKAADGYHIVRFVASYGTRGDRGVYRVEEVVSTSGGYRVLSRSRFDRAEIDRIHWRSSFV